MIPKFEQMLRIGKTGIIAVIRAEAPEEALSIAEAVKKGGIDVIEITFTVPGAARVMEELHQAYPDEEILLGAGTVLDAETARLAMLAGAQYVVSPHLSHDIARLCNRYQKIYMPGCMTVTEMVWAMEEGVELIKLFPGNTFGPGYIKDLKGPLPQVQIVPTGGVSLDNVDQWMQKGAFAVGVGGQLTGGAKLGDFEQVTETARKFVKKIQDARE